MYLFCFVGIILPLLVFVSQAQSTHGMRVYVRGSNKIFHGEFVSRKAVAMRRVSVTRKMVMESGRAKKNSSARLRLGFEEIAKTTEASWSNDDPRSVCCAGEPVGRAGMYAKNFAVCLLSVSSTN